MADKKPAPRDDLERTRRDPAEVEAQRRTEQAAAERTRRINEQGRRDPLRRGR